MINNLISKEIWNDRYRKHDETFEEQLKRVADYIGSTDKEKQDFYDVMMNGLFYPAGRTMSNSGIGKSLTLNNCFSLNFVPDSMEGIFNFVKYGAITQKAGGGTGYNFSLLRPNGTPTSNEAIASGVVSFMNAFDAQTHTVLQGSRRGANMGCLCIYHPDIYEFLESKSWDEGKLTHFNLSFLVDDKFMEAVEKDENIYLRYPCMTENGDFIYDEDKWDVKKEVNARELWNLIMEKAYNTGEYGVLYYDNMNKDNNLKYMEKIVTTNPCGEYLSGVITLDGKARYDYFGACNLGSLFLHNFVENPFTKKAKIDMDKLEKAIRVGVRLLDDIIDINNYPLENYANYQKNIRTIGLGITGLADLFVMLGLEYGDEISIQLTDELMDFIVYTAYDESCNLAKEKGSFNFLNKEKFVESNFIKKHIERNPKWNNIKEKILKDGIRNARLISIAPTGTLSLSYGNNCSSGLEPIFSLEYDRKIKVGGQDEEHERIYKMRDYAYGEWLEFNNENNIVNKDVFKTSMELSVKSHLDILSTIAFHTDMSCSKTINIPTEYPFEDMKDVYMECWKRGIKGCTVFRPNEVRQGILLTNEDKKQDEKSHELKRGEWEVKPQGCIEIPRKIYSGCGKELLHITIDPKERRIIDFYITSSSTGGCKLNIQALAISMSAILRLGGSIENIKCAFRGIGKCPSYILAKEKGKKVSKGVSCPTAILNVLMQVDKDLKEEKLEELQLLGYYDKKEFVAFEKKEDMDKSGEEVVESIKEFEKQQEQVKELKKEIFTEKELEYIKEYGEVAFAQAFSKCPKCGEKMEHIGGCISCMNCAFTKCE